MAYGCPAIAFDCDYGPRHIIKHMQTGLLVPDGNIFMYSEKTIFFLKNQNLRFIFQKNMKAELQKYSSRIVLEKWQDLISSIEKI